MLTKMIKKTIKIFAVILLLTISKNTYGAGVLLPIQGGTGNSTYSAGDILFASTSNPYRLEKLSIGTTGQVLGVSAGKPAWITNTGGGSGGGTFSTTSPFGTTQLQYPTVSNTVTSLDTSSTSTSKWWYNPNNNIQYIGANVGIGTSTPTKRLVVSDSTPTLRINSASVDTVGTLDFFDGVSGDVSGMVRASNNAGNDFITIDRGPTALVDSLGIFAGNTMRIRLNSIEQARFTTSGLGIASTSPFGLLSINPNGITGPSFVIGSSTATNFIITNGGNVGIGTSSPISPLSIVGNPIAVKSGPSFMKFQRTDIAGSAKSSVGMLGTGEANLSYNMDYTDGTHRYYDSSKNAMWLALNASGWAIQYAPTGGTGDVWNTTGNNYALYGFSDGRTVLGTDLTSITNNTYSSRLTLPRAGGAPSLSGDTDLVIEGHRTVGTSGIVYINSYNNGNILLARGGGNVGIGTTSPYAKLSVVGEAVAEYFTSTSTSLTNTFPRLLSTNATTTNLGVSNINSIGSAGIQFHNNIGQNVLLLGAGGSQGATFSGGVTLSSLSDGCLYTSSNLITSTGSACGSGGGSTIGWASSTDPQSIYFTGTNNVGIGSSTPPYKLTIKGIDTTGTLNLVTTDSSNNTTFSIDNTGTIRNTGTIKYPTTNNDMSDGSGLYYNSASGHLVIGSSGIYYDDGTTLADSTGNLYTQQKLGIGTTSPWAQLSVNPNGITGPSFVIGSSTATNFIVTNGGNVGIGSTSPQLKLVVSGGVIIGDTFYIATSSNMTLDFTKANAFQALMSTTAYTINMNSPMPSLKYTVNTCNPRQASGGAVTFASNLPIIWPSPYTMPTQTTTASHCDKWVFNVNPGTTTPLSPFIEGSQIPY